MENRVSLGKKERKGCSCSSIVASRSLSHYDTDLSPDLARGRRPRRRAESGIEIQTRATDHVFDTRVLTDTSRSLQAPPVQASPSLPPPPVIERCQGRASSGCHGFFNFSVIFYCLIRKSRGNGMYYKFLLKVKSKIYGDVE